MKIVIINDYASVQGGAAQVAVKSAVGLAELGFSVTFIYGSGSPDSILIHKNIDLISFGLHDLLNNPSRIEASILGIWNTHSEKKIIDILNKFDKSKTIIHVHSWVKSLSVSIFSAILRSGFQSVLTLHDYFTACPNGGFYNYKEKKICKLKPMSASCLVSNCDARNYYQKVWRLIRQLVYMKAKFPKGLVNFITVSDFSERILRPYLSEKASFWRVLNPIDVIKASPVVPSENSKFTYIGRLSPEKGVMLLTQLRSIPQEDLQIVGAGELELYLKNKLPNSKFFGWCNSEEIKLILEDSRALLFPSQWYETQGLVVAEAAARGVPAIVSDSTAAKEFVEHGKSGLLFNSGSVESLEKQLSLLYNDKLVDSLGNYAYQQFWNSSPTLESHVISLVNCYASILKLRAVV